MSFRRSEIIVFVYFVYASVLAAVLPLSTGIRERAILVNLSILAVYAFVIYGDRAPGREVLRVARDWIPLAMALLAYQEMGWFAPREHSFTLERRWIVVDRLVLRNWHLHAAIERFGAVAPTILEMSYMLVYSLAPFALAMLYAYGARKRIDRFLVIFLFGVLLSYVQFPFWPSEPPRTVFPGEDAPTVQTIFRRFNWLMLGGLGIHTSVFPSAHVSGAFSVAFGVMRTLPERRWVGRFLLVMAILIATATVYGRYHYVVDALAGFAVSVLALVLGRWVDRWSRA